MARSGRKIHFVFQGGVRNSLPRYTLGVIHELIQQNFSCCIPHHCLTRRRKGLSSHLSSYQPTTRLDAVTVAVDAIGGMVCNPYCYPSCLLTRLVNKTDLKWCRVCCYVSKI